MLSPTLRYFPYGTWSVHEGVCSSDPSTKALSLLFSLSTCTLSPSLRFSLLSFSLSSPPFLPSLSLSSLLRLPLFSLPTTPLWLSSSFPLLSSSPFPSPLLPPSPPFLSSLPLLFSLPLLLSPRDLGLEQFGSLVISRGRVQDRVVKGTLSLIHKER